MTKKVKDTPNCWNKPETKVMLALAYFANLGYNIDEHDCEAAKDIAALIDDALKTEKILNNEWELVWGPVVFRFPFIAKTRDNTFYVAQNKKDRSRYVLAIAGTNPCEIWDWLIEDLSVEHQVHWAYGNAPAAAKISTSAVYSLGILQGAIPCLLRKGELMHLKTFLKLAVALHKKVSFTVTGHSLGGEMATTAALWLADTQLEWDPNSKATVSTYCFAGPTAGNAEWAAYYDSRLGDRTCRVWNSKDVVPHAFNINDLSQIPDLYLSAGIDMEFLSRLMLDGLMTRLVRLRSNYTQIIEGQDPLPGTVDPSNGNSFFAQAGYQHVDAYPKLLGWDWTSNKIDCKPPKSLLER